MKKKQNSHSTQGLSGFFHYCSSVGGGDLGAPSIRPGADPGGGVPGGQDPPFWGTRKLHKEGKNVPRVCAKTLRFST